jgi:hypothetical protein
MGILRLVRVAFAPMPRVVAVCSAVVGIVVCGFAVFVGVVKVPAAAPTTEPVVTLSPAFSGPAPEQLGTVHVQVRTVSGPVAGIPVSLESRFAADAAPQKVNQTTDTSGNVTFANVNINPGSPWVAVAHYDGRDFTSSLLRSGRSITLDVANVTFDPKRLHVDASSIAIVGDKDGIEAVQAMTIVNRSDEAFAGGLSLPLLNDATAVDPRVGLDRNALTLDQNNQIVSSTPVMSGSHEVTYTYIAPMGRDGSPFRMSIFYPTSRVDVLIGNTLVFTPKGALRSNGKVTLAGRTYHRYTATRLHARQHLTGQIAVPKPSHAPEIALLILAILIALGIVLLPLFRRRRREEEPAPEALPEKQPEWT